MTCIVTSNVNGHFFFSNPTPDSGDRNGFDIPLACMCLCVLEK